MKQILVPLTLNQYDKIQKLQTEFIMNNTSNKTKRRRLEGTQSSTLDDTTLSKRYGIGAKILAQMGYVNGKGLGAAGTGIVEPIQAFGGSSSNSSSGTITIDSSMKRAGLGMFSAIKEHDYDTEIESSDDEVYIDSATNIKSKNSPGVTFERSEVVLNHEVDIKSQFLKRVSTLTAIDTQVGLEESLRNATDRTLQENRFKIESMLDELEDLTRRIERLSGTQIPLIESEFNDIVAYEDLLRKLLSLETKNVTIPQVLEMVPQILDTCGPQDTVRSDKLVSRLLLKLFHRFDFDPLEEVDNDDEQLTVFLNKLPALLQPLDSSSNNMLNETQTVLFKLVYPKLRPYWETIDLYNGEAVDLALSLLLQYEPILKYIKCYKPVIVNYIEPQFMQFAEQWSVDDVDRHPSFSIVDFKLLELDQRTVSKVNQILINKLELKCQNMNLEDPIPMSFSFSSSSSSSFELNMLFLKEFLGYDSFYEVIRRHLVPKFFRDVWETYFDPLVELEDWENLLHEQNRESSNSNNGNSNRLTVSELRGTGLCIHQLRCLHNIFPPNEYNKFVKAIFNELNKILFQWIVYAENRRTRSEARSWFNWFINSYFKTPVLPLRVEIDEIRRTLSFLDKYCELEVVFPDRIVAIHTETETVTETGLSNDDDDDDDVVVVSEHDLQDSSGKYNIQNIPMQRVQPTFRDVVEDYCEEHGYVLRKLGNRYAQLPNSSTLAPVFEVSNNRSKRKYVCIRDDVLWGETEGSDDGYRPMYLWQLKLDD